MTVLARPLRASALLVLACIYHLLQPSPGWAQCSTVGAPLPFSPSDGSSVSDAPVLLRWAVAVGADIYDVYLGTDPSPDSGEFLATVTSGSYLVTIPLRSGMKYYWQIVARNACGNVGAGPVVSFTYMGEPFIVTQPASGTAWTPGTSACVTWNSPENCGANVNIYLYKGTANAGTIVIGTPNDGSYCFVTNDGLVPGSDYRVLVVTSGPGCEDFSDYFTVSAGASCLLSVEEPDAGTSWMGGSPATIRWTATGSSCGDRVNVSLLKGSAVVSILAAGAPNSGQLAVTVPTGLSPGTDYRILIASALGAGSAYSSYFAVTGSMFPACVIFPGSISFGSVGVGRSAVASVILRNEGGGTLFGTARVDAPAFSIVGPSSYLLRGGEAVVLRVEFTPPRAGTHVGTLILSESPCPAVPLSGLGVSPCEPAIVSPDSTTVWFGGTLVSVSWRAASGVCEQPVDLDLYRGDEWVYSIAGSITNTGFHAFRLPDGLGIGREYRVRLRTEESSTWSQHFSIDTDATTVLYPVEDAYVGYGGGSTADPAANYGSRTSLYFGADAGKWFYRAYQRFEPSEIPRDRLLLRAELWLRRAACLNCPTSMEVRLPEGPWLESTLTWNNQPELSEPRFERTVFGSGAFWEVVDVTDIVAGWVEGSTPNYGFALTGASASSYGAVTSREWGESVDFRSFLRITTSVPAVYPDRIDFESLVEGEQRGAAIRVSNRSADALRLGRIELPGDPGFSVAPEFLDSLLAGLDIAPLSYRSVPVFFQPPGPGAYRATLRVLDAESDTLAEVPLEGTAERMKFNWLTRDLYPTGRVRAGQDVVLPLVFAEGVSPDSVVLVYGPGGAVPSRHARMTLSAVEAGGARFVGVVPRDALSERGLIFMARVFNGPAESRSPEGNGHHHLRVEIPSLTFPEPQRPERYRMISFPMETEGNVFGVLGDDLAQTEWRMWTYDAEGENYVEIPDPRDRYSRLEQGRAYWLVTRREVLLDTGPSPGSSTALDSVFTLALAPGWNQVANPFPFPVGWSDCSSRRAGSGEPVQLDAPVGWNEPENAYVYGATILDPFDGYWVKNAEPDTVLLAVPPWTVDEAPTSKPGTEAEPGAWSVTLALSTGSWTDGGHLLGARAGASDEWDPADVPAPPPAPGAPASLYFANHAWRSRAGRYACDLRSPLEQGADGSTEQEWRIGVDRVDTETSPTREFTISWKGMESVPGELDVRLVDRELQTEIDMRVSRSCRFVVHSARAADDAPRFRIRAATRVPGEEPPSRAPGFGIVSLVPNPTVGGAVIRYRVETAGDVEIAIFDSRGRLVRRLTESHAAPGSHERLWEGDTLTGRPAGPGLYLVRIVANGRVDTRKLIRME